MGRPSGRPAARVRERRGQRCARSGGLPCEQRQSDDCPHRALPGCVVGAGRERPADHGVQPAADADRRAADTDPRRARARPGARRAARDRRPQRGAQGRAADGPRGRLLLLLQTRCAVPCELLLPDGCARDELAHDPAEAAHLRGARSPARRGVLRQPAPGPRARDRPHRLRQVDLARRDHRLHQPEPALPHHHHRGSRRVRAHAQAVGGEPA